LKRVFGIEVEQPLRCAGRFELIASIEEPEPIESILAAGDFPRDRKAKASA
jgi:hypothetical protein